MTYRKLRFLFILIISIALIAGCSGDDSGGNFLDNAISKIVEMLLGGPQADDSADSDTTADDWAETEADSIPDSLAVSETTADSMEVAMVDTSDAATEVTEAEARPPQPETESEPAPTGTSETVDTEMADEDTATSEIADTGTDSGGEETQPMETAAADTITRTEDFSEALSEIRRNKRRSSGQTDFASLRNPFNFDPNNVIEPPPPKEPERPPLPPIELGNITLDGIMWNEQKRQALITGEDGKGYFIEIGDKIKGATVEDIQPDRVIFVQRFYDQVQRLELKLKKDEG